VIQGIMHKNRKCGRTKPKCTLLWRTLRQESHRLLTTSRAHTHNPLGMPINSVKKSAIAQIRYTPRMGENSIFPTGAMSESGNPQPTKIGNEINVKNRCVNKKVVK
jgi:hypothetical protein